MANNLPTTYIKKLQVGARGDFEDTFTFKVGGDTGSFGFPSMTEAQRDIIWPPASFPDANWKGGTIYNDTVQRLQFNTGAGWFTLEAGAPPSSIAAFYQQYIDDAEYVFNNGPAVNGSVYYNTTFNSVRVFSNGAWYNDLIPQPWANSTSFNVGQIVWVGIKIFRCTIAHISNAGGTIDDDIANWAEMGAYNISELDDVDLTGIQAGSILEWNGVDSFIVSQKGSLETALTLKELAADPSTPAVGYVNIYAKTDKRIYLQDSNDRVTLLEVPLNVIDFANIDASTLVQNVWLEVIASTSAEARRVQIFDAAGYAFEWGVGAAASEVTKFLSGAGSNEPTDIEIPAGSRLAVRTAEAGPYSGTIIVNVLG